MQAKTLGSLAQLQRNKMIGQVMVQSVHEGYVDAATAAKLDPIAFTARGSWQTYSLETEMWAAKNVEHFNLCMPLLNICKLHGGSWRK